MNGLPPGLRGFVAAEQLAQNRGINGLNQLQLMMGLQGLVQQQAAARDRQQFMQQFAQRLPEGERAAFMLSPDTFIKERFAPFTLKPGEQRFVGDQPGPSLPLTPSLHNIPVPDKPGVTQPTWLRPGESAGTAVGGTNQPDILNPDVEAVRTRLARASAPQIQTAVNMPPASMVFQNENKLRDDYVTASKPFIGLRDAYNTVQASLSGPITAASTLAGATKFMKMIDPDSVVRESELNLALKSTGMLDRFLNLHNTVTKGQVLTPTQASEIKNIAETLYGAAEKQQRQTDAYFTGLAKEYGLEPKRVIRDQRAVMRRRSTDTDQDVYDAADAIIGR